MWYAGPFEAYDVGYLPLHVLLDRQGKIAAVNLDPRGQLGPAIERLLAEGAAQPTSTK
jgi:hypothetical protein